MAKTLYTAHATATGGRNGHVKSSDGILDFETRTPKEMGGSGGSYTNPEQLFAAGYSACFDGALGVAIRLSKIKTGMTSVTANVDFCDDGQGGFCLAVELTANIPEVTQEEADKLVAQAHQICPYSRATRNNIEVKVKATIA